MNKCIVYKINLQKFQFISFIKQDKSIKKKAEKCY